MKSLLKVVAVAGLMCLAFSGTAQAFNLGGTSPEIDPGSMASALTLLAGAGMLVADKLRRKAK